MNSGKKTECHYLYVCDPEEYILQHPGLQAEFDEQLDRARTYISDQSWCRCVKKVWAGRGLIGKFFSFLITIEPAYNYIPIEHWVIVGDIPTAYISIDGNFDAYSALIAYIGVMYDWVHAVRRNGDVSECFPVNVPPTQHWADELAGRLEFIKACLIFDDATPEDVREKIRKERLWDTGNSLETDPG